MVDPYRIVFLAMLSDEAFFGGREWKFDLALGSSLYQEMEDIVTSQITLPELAYETESGERIAAEAVVEDLILQGARANREFGARERNWQQTLQDEGEPDSDNGGEIVGAYDPLAAMSFYCDRAQYVEAMWLEDLW